MLVPLLRYDAEGRPSMVDTGNSPYKRTVGQRVDLNESETTGGGTGWRAEQTRATSADGTRDRAAADVVREAKQSSHCTYMESRSVCVDA